MPVPTDFPNLKTPINLEIKFQNSIKKRIKRESEIFPP